MMYIFDILTALFAMATGFATSWIGLELARLCGWREPVSANGPASPVRIGAEMTLTAVVGPWLLLINGFHNWRSGVVSLPLYTVLALVAVGWSMCSGVVVLQAAFASGYFLA
ncbi:hypothetical protein OEG84_04570 [Hoeflea sp. G2-23]|uniref:Uncharacterized protein n=1 Tax=Hoeflea algicola TaxID=2983763 RepID=A0ABT3Z5G2_9HYPH|nr:hypothetical protein [Hoeflea algicola]MCY0147011.1 hypothetical protein [Hoeflea algicola]